MEQHPPRSEAAPAHTALGKEDQLRAALVELQSLYPGWKLWPTDNLRMVAATLIDPAAGTSPTLVEDTIEDLAAALEWERDAAERYGSYKPPRSGCF